MENYASRTSWSPPTEADFLAQVGLIVSGRELARMLGYRSPAALRQAIHRRTLNLNTFFIRGRRGRCARTIDVVRWVRERAAHQQESPTTR